MATKLRIQHDTQRSSETSASKFTLVIGLIMFLLGVGAGSTMSVLETAKGSLKGNRLERQSVPADTALPPENLDGVQFVFMIGLEGTGHHFMQQLVKDSPSRKAALKLRIDPGPLRNLTEWLSNTRTKVGLLDAHCKQGATTDVVRVEEAVVQNFQRIHTMVRNAKANGQLDPDTIFRIPINTVPNINVVTFGMQSYPNFGGPCRKLSYPSLDLLYTACQKAQVDCRHVHMYRDPKQVLASTTIKRPYNRGGLLQAIHMYKSLLHIMASEMATYRSQTLACIGFYDKPTFDHWTETIRQLWGWTDQKEFDAFLTKTYKPPSSDEVNDDWLPDTMAPYMKVLRDAHQDTLDVCRSGPYQIETGVRIPSDQ